jgi:hypothetical protein
MVMSRTLVIKQGFVLELCSYLDGSVQGLSYRPDLPKGHCLLILGLGKQGKSCLSHHTCCSRHWRVELFWLKGRPLKLRGLAACLLSPKENDEAQSPGATDCPPVAMQEASLRVRCTQRGRWREI